MVTMYVPKATLRKSQLAYIDILQNSNDEEITLTENGAFEI